MCGSSGAPPLQSSSISSPPLVSCASACRPLHPTLGNSSRCGRRCITCFFSFSRCSSLCLRPATPTTAGKAGEKERTLGALRTCSSASRSSLGHSLLLVLLLSIFCSSSCIPSEAFFVFCCCWLGVLYSCCPGATASARSGVTPADTRHLEGLLVRLCCCCCFCWGSAAPGPATALQFAAVRWGNVTFTDGLSRQYRWTPLQGYQRVYIDQYQTALYQDGPAPEQRQQEPQQMSGQENRRRGQQKQQKVQQQHPSYYWGHVLHRFARSEQAGKVHRRSQQHQRKQQQQHYEGEVRYGKKEWQQPQQLQQQGLYAYEPLLTSVSPDGKWLGVLNHHCPRQDYLEQDNVQAAQGSAADHHKDRPYSCSAFLYLYDQTKGELQSRTELLLPPGDTRILGFALQLAAAPASTQEATAKAAAVSLDDGGEQDEEKEKAEAEARGGRRVVERKAGKLAAAAEQVTGAAARAVADEASAVPSAPVAAGSGASAPVAVAAASTGPTTAFPSVAAASVSPAAASATAPELLNLNLLAWRRAAPHGETCACKQQRCNIFFDSPRRAQCYEEGYSLSPAAQLIWPSQTQVLCLHDGSKTVEKQQQPRKPGPPAGPPPAAAQIRVPYCETPTLREDWTCANSAAAARSGAAPATQWAPAITGGAATHRTAAAAAAGATAAVTPCRELPLLPGTTVGTFYLGNLPAEEPVSSSGNGRGTTAANNDGSGSTVRSSRSHGGSSIATGSTRSTTGDSNSTDTSASSKNSTSQLKDSRDSIDDVHSSRSAVFTISNSGKWRSNATGGNSSRSRRSSRDASSSTMGRGTVTRSSDTRNVQVDVQQKEGVISLLKAFDGPASYNDLRVLLPSNPHRNRVVLRACVDTRRAAATAPAARDARTAAKTNTYSASKEAATGAHAGIPVGGDDADSSGASAAPPSAAARWREDPVAPTLHATAVFAEPSSSVSLTSLRAHSAVLLDTLAEYTSPAAGADASLKVLPSCFVLHTHSSAAGFTPNAAVAADGSCTGCSGVGVLLPRTCGGPVLVWCIATVAVSGWVPGLYINSSYFSRSSYFLNLWDLAGHPTGYRNQYTRYTNLRNVHIFEHPAAYESSAAAAAAAASPSPPPSPRTRDGVAGFTDAGTASRAAVSAALSADHADGGVGERVPAASFKGKSNVANVYDMFYIIDLLETASHSRWGSAVPVSELRLSRLHLVLESRSSGSSNNGRIIANAVPLRRAWAPELMHLQVISTRSDVLSATVAAAAPVPAAPAPDATVTPSTDDRRRSTSTAKVGSVPASAAVAAHKGVASDDMTYYAPGSAAAAFRAATTATLATAEAAASASSAAAAASLSSTVLPADYLLQYENAVERTTHFFTVGAELQRDTSSFETVLPAAVVVDPLALGNDMYGTPLIEVAPDAAAAAAAAAGSVAVAAAAAASTIGGSAGAQSAAAAEAGRIRAAAGREQDARADGAWVKATGTSAAAEDAAAGGRGKTPASSTAAAAHAGVAPVTRGVALRIGEMVQQQSSPVAAGGLPPVAAGADDVLLLTGRRGRRVTEAASKSLRKVWGMPQFAAADPAAAAAANKPRYALYVETEVQHACARGEFHPSLQQATCRSTCHKVVEYMVEAADTSDSCPLLLDSHSSSSTRSTSSNSSRVNSASNLSSIGDANNRRTSSRSTTSRSSSSRSVSSGSSTSRSSSSSNLLVVFPCSGDLCSYVEFDVSQAAAQANAAAAALERAALAAAAGVAAVTSSRKGAAGSAAAAAAAAAAEAAAAGVELVADAAAAGVVAAAQGGSYAAATAVVEAVTRAAAAAAESDETAATAGVVVTAAAEAVEAASAGGTLHSSRAEEVVQLLQRAVDRDVNTRGPTFFLESSVPAAAAGGGGEEANTYVWQKTVAAAGTGNRRGAEPAGLGDEPGKNGAAAANRAAVPASATPADFFHRYFASPLFLSFATPPLLRRKAAAAAAEALSFSAVYSSSTSSSPPLLFTQVTFPVAGVADVWEVLLLFERAASRKKDEVLVILHHSEKEEAARLRGVVGGQLAFPVYVHSNKRGVHEAAPGAAVLWTDLDIKAVTALTVRHRSRTHAAALLEMQVKGVSIRCPHNGFFALSTYPPAVSAAAAAASAREAAAAAPAAGGAAEAAAVVGIDVGEAARGKAGAWWGNVAAASRAANAGDADAARRASAAGGAAAAGSSFSSSSGACALQRRKTIVAKLEDLDCQGEWTEWSVCSSSCRSTRFFVVRRYARPGGKPCSSFDTKPCGGSPFCSGTADARASPSPFLSPAPSSSSSPSNFSFRLPSSSSPSFPSSVETAFPGLLRRPSSSVLLQEAKQQDCVLQQSAWSEDCVNCRNIRFLHVVAAAAAGGVACPAPEQRLETRFCSAECEKSFNEGGTSGGGGEGGGSTEEGGGENDGESSSSTSTSTRSTTSSSSSSSTNWKERLLALPWYVVASTFVINLLVLLLLFTVARCVLKSRYHARMQRLLQQERQELAGVAEEGEGQRVDAADDAGVSGAAAHAAAAALRKSPVPAGTVFLSAAAAGARVGHERRPAEAAAAARRQTAAVAAAEAGEAEGKRRATGAAPRVSDTTASGEVTKVTPVTAITDFAHAKRGTGSQSQQGKKNDKRRSNASTGRNEDTASSEVKRQRARSRKTAATAGHHQQETLRFQVPQCTDTFFDSPA